MTEKLERLPRCCARHTDWPTLVAHLCQDFPAVESEQVLRNVVDARNVAERFNLDLTEALDVGELIVRYRLMLSTGQIPDVARTDPQTHHVGGAAAALDEAPISAAENTTRV
jgi:hypothetical protein